MLWFLNPCSKHFVLLFSCDNFSDCTVPPVSYAEAKLENGSVASNFVTKGTKVNYLCQSDYSPKTAQQVVCGIDGVLNVSNVSCYKGKLFILLQIIYVV